jgi:type IV pilus assembly protein PilX
MNMQKATVFQTNKLRSRQQGAVLLFCIIFLAVLTLMAVTGMETTIVEERMAGNMQEFNQAFQAAEIAMEDGEAWLGVQINLPSTSNNGSTTVWSPNGPDPDSDNVDWWWERDTTWWGNSAEVSEDLAVVGNQPQYVIEEFFTTTEGQSLTIGTGELENSRVLHRVTSRGVGVTTNAQVILQSTYIRPYD